VADPTQTLAQGSDQVNWYGEVYQTDETLTSTDMGSGEWPWTRFTHSAFIKNITWIDADSILHDYDRTQHSIVSDERGILWRRIIRVGLIGGRVICGLEGLGLVGRLGLKVKGPRTLRLNCFSLFVFIKYSWFSLILLMLLQSHQVLVACCSCCCTELTPLTLVE
jgi:hypothetical protein